MLHFIRTNRISKIVACYLAIQIVIQMTQPLSAYALTSGPSQPEFNTFTPIGTSDMVDLPTGDFNYNIPIMDVGGYPLNLSYQSGITTDQEASWVGLGWNLNVGQISRQVRGIPDDFNGDTLRYENNIRDNFTVGMETGVRAPIFGNDFLELGVGIGMKYNNYDGMTFSTSYGASFDITEQISVGLNISSSETGPSASPTIGLKSKKLEKNEISKNAYNWNIGLPFNSRQGIQSLNLSVSKNKVYQDESLNKSKGYIGGSLSFNDNLSFTPTNQLGFSNVNLTLNFGLGTEIYGPEMPQFQLTAFGSIQKLLDKDKNVATPAFGYNYTENASPLNSVLDFNRENDRKVTKNTLMLPIVNQTFDLYSIRGQGIGGMFRAHRSQVGYVYDKYTSSFGEGGSVGFELGPGAGAHFGANIKANPSFSHSGLWSFNDGNFVLNEFDIRNNEASQRLDYEPFYYKMTNELNADPEPIIHAKLNYSAPMKIGIGGGEYNRNTLFKYEVKKYAPNNQVYYEDNELEKIKRKYRLPRTQNIQTITLNEATSFGGNFDGQINLDGLPDGIKDEHIVGIKITKPIGTKYVYGEAAYNIKKVESTFAVNTACSLALTDYSSNDDSSNNSKGRDNYYSKIITPTYAYSYLLTSVLSTDYQDLTNDGPTLDDLGAFTNFEYYQPYEGTYNWRTPYQEGKALFSENLRTDAGDNKGNYVSGEKELKYVRLIETKTHVAYFLLTDRKDAQGVGTSSSKMQKIEKIFLFSRPVFDMQVRNLVENNNNPNPSQLTEQLMPFALKIAHFEYDGNDSDSEDDYDLCPNTPNSTGAGGGKLSLKRLYFTYGNSYMGQFSPYTFEYDNFNPDYHIRGYDIWGNFKPVVEGLVTTNSNGDLEYTEPTGGYCGINDPITATAFPFVQQKDKALQDAFASAWTLSAINLPSGGKIEMDYETDDYQYVQDKKAMQMFKVSGIGNTATTSNPTQNKLYVGSDDKDYLYVEIANGTSALDFRQNYLGTIGENDGNPLYFRFLLNMTSNKYDYVTGYCTIDKNAGQVFTANGKTYGSIKLKRVKREGGLVNSNQMVNPIAKAGWLFGRKHLNRQVYGINAPTINDPGDFLALAQSFQSAIEVVADIFNGPNQVLRQKNCAQRFVPAKSWVRLQNPIGRKYGGGLRVKKLVLKDNWDNMTGNAGDDLYGNYYGKEYNYNNLNGSSSGVATFEPNGSHENPLIVPFYDKAEKLIAPKMDNYVEKPIGKSLYPYPKITYGRVTVSNLERTHEGLTLTKHATGRMVTEFYTSKDFPTRSDFTDITPKVDITGILGSILKVRTNKSLTFSQGFSITTNDMDGKIKAQWISAENQPVGEYISGIEYKYALDEEGKLDNHLNVLAANGAVSKKQIGVSLDVIHDFRNSYNKSEVAGIDGNLAALLMFIGILPVPALLPVIQVHEQELNTATTTKLVHKTGILVEKVVYDLGASTTTKNLAWDAETGQVLVSETNSEYNDQKYYTLDYPAKWYYKEMGLASKNTKIRGIIGSENNGYYNIIHPYSTGNITNGFFTKGDEVRIEFPFNFPIPFIPVMKFWVVDVDDTGRIALMNEAGEMAPAALGGLPIEEWYCTVYKSGFQNLPLANMATITSQKNPLVDTNGNGLPDMLMYENWVHYNILNASAIEYTDAWNSQCEFQLPYEADALLSNGDINDFENIDYNPYLYNVKGMWRPVRSYAYLTARNNGDENFNPRDEGFFEEFTPFYQYFDEQWNIEESGWTFASEVTKYSPYGSELENRDALGRYSAAQYGYYYRLPMAVASNSTYEEIGFDGFEDYDYVPEGSADVNPHFGFHDAAEDYSASIVEMESHSGRNSILVGGNQNVRMIKQVVPCEIDTTIIWEKRPLKTE